MSDESDRVRVLVLDQARGVWGAQSYLLRLADPLARHGIDLTLGAPPELELTEAWRARGLPHVEIPLPMSRSVRTDGDGSRLSAGAVLHEASVLRRSAREIADVARRTGADVIHANGHAVHLDAALAGRMAGIPVVLHLHEEMTQRFGRSLRAAAVTIADETIAVSRAVAAGLPRALRSAATVVSNGVDVEEFAPGAASAGVRAALGAAPGDVLLVALTRLDPEKRIEDLVHALAPLRDRPGWHLAVVGATSSYPDYARDVRELGASVLGSRVSFAGRREDVVDILRSADIVVHAGVVEGMPLGLIEAQACGVPVVAYRVAGVPEAVVDATTGLLAAAGDSTQLGAHMARLIGDPALRASMGAAGRRHALANHSIDAQAEAQATLLQTLARRRRRWPALGGRRTRIERQARIEGRPPRILLANHWHDDNRGDSAITQGILTLIRELAPDSRVTVTGLAENGALWQGSTRHLEQFWPGLQVRPSPVPTELRGRTGERSRAGTAVDAAIWAARLTRHVPSLSALPGWSGWDALVRDSDLVIAVGGSNVFDDAGVPAVLGVPRLAEVLSPLHAAARAGVPAVMLGHTLGPFARRSGHRLARRLVRRVDRAVVRETTSVAVARELGIARVEEAPDMAFAIVPERSPAVDRMIDALPASPGRTLVLSARRHPTLGRDADERLVAVFADAARRLVRSGRIDGVAVIAHTIGPTPIEDDRPISRQLVADLSDIPVTLVDEDVSPAELSAFYGAVAAVVAVRLHAAILALNAGTPTFAVSYLTAKTVGVMTQVGLPHSVADFATVSAEQIEAGVGVLLDDPELRPLLDQKSAVRRKELFEASTRWFPTLAGGQIRRPGG